MYKVDTYFNESIDKYTKEEYTNTVVKIEYRGVEQLAARRAHNPKVVSSSLTPATTSQLAKRLAVFLFKKTAKALALLLLFQKKYRFANNFFRVF